MNDFEFKKYISKWLSQSEHLQMISEESDMTQEEVSKALDISRATVVNIEKRAKENVRKKLLARYNVSSMDDLL